MRRRPSLRRPFATAKKAFTEVKVARSNTLLLQLWQQELVKFKAEVVQFGALALLNNPLLGHAGKRGRISAPSSRACIVPSPPLTNLRVGFLWATRCRSACPWFLRAELRHAGRHAYYMVIRMRICGEWSGLYAPLSCTVSGDGVIAD